MVKSGVVITVFMDNVLTDQKRSQSRDLEPPTVPWPFGYCQGGNRDFQGRGQVVRAAHRWLA